MAERDGGFFSPVSELMGNADRRLLFFGLSLLFASFFRSIIGATTFQTPLEIGFCVGASLILCVALLLDCVMSNPAMGGLTLPLAMSAGALLDVVCGAILGRTSTTYITLAFVLCGCGILFILYKRSWKHRDGSQLENRAACTYDILAFPLAYLAALIVALGLIFGCLFLLHVGGLNRGISQLGFFVGCAVFALIVVPLMLATDRNLELVAKMMLLFLVTGFLLIMLNQPSFMSLLILALGFCCFLFVCFTMIFDFYRTFALPLPFAMGYLMMTFVSLLIGYALGQLLALSSSIENLGMFTMVSVVLVNVITILGLGTRHSWNVQDLLEPKQPLLQDPVAKAGVFKRTLEEISREAGLTAREQEVFALMAKGRNSAAIEKALVISNHTARAHVLSIYRKLDLHSQQAVLDYVDERVAENREKMGR